MPPLQGAQPDAGLPGQLSQRDTVLDVEPQDLPPLLGIKHPYPDPATARVWSSCGVSVIDKAR